MKNNEIKQQNELKRNCFVSNNYAFMLVIFVFSSIILLAGGWPTFPFAQTQDLPKYLSEKLSRSGKYSIKIENVISSYPIIIGNNISYKSLKGVASLSFKIKELTVNPDYSNFELGTHSFRISNGKLLFRRRKFLLMSNNIEMEGQYSQKQIYIASSTWKMFGGNACINGCVDTKANPSRYNLCAELFAVKLEDILSNTKNRGSFTGNVSGLIKVSNESDDPSFVFGTAYLSIFNGTYNQPKLVDKINNAFHKFGLQSILKDVAETIASSPFLFRGDFLINGKSYLTENAVFKTPWGTVKYIGRIGPKSALNGILVVYFKNYSSFYIRINGSDTNNLNYKITDGDKARLASIILREASKETEKQLKNDGRKTNKKINKGFKSLEKETRKLFKNL
ncbi:MAG: hypothetical protein IKP71_01730 [Candidatus Riflebacteria bacterium]|nr:hypothetical protein [Candidatus Riflebacteria bacterium]